MKAITPNHLLLQKPNAMTLSPGHFDDVNLICCKRWKQLQILADHYWRRWLREYLLTLQECQKWNNPRRNLAVNDLVVVVDENAPRGQWLLGRIMTVFPGKEGFVWSAEVKTKHSTLHRPIRKLCLLEASDA